MPNTIKFSDNPNEETAFVETDGGQRNRAVLTAAVDGEIEYPANPNSTKVSVTVDGVKRKAVAVATIAGGGGGGSVDYAKTVQRVETMPTADASNAGQQFLYSGESDATYTHGYIYENVATTTSSSASAEQTVGSTLSDIAVDLVTLESFTGWTTDNSLQIFYTADGWSVDATSLGVTYTGTPNVGDAITITYTAESTTYSWTRVDVQPAPEAIKVNTTATLAVADWSSNTQTISVSGVTSTSVVLVAPAPSDATDYATAGILCTSQAAGTLTFTATTTPSSAISVNIVCL